MPLLKRSIHSDVFIAVQWPHLGGIPQLLEERSMGPPLKPIPFCGVDAGGRWPDVVGSQRGFPGTGAATRPAGAAPVDLMVFLLRPRALRTWD